MSGATPGPWKYGLGYIIRPDRGLDANGREIGGPTIAEVNSDADRGCPSDDEIDANGHLIAAAPDLLAACEAARELCITVLGEVDADNVRKWADDTFARLEAAIGKARAQGQ